MCTQSFFLTTPLARLEPHIALWHPIRTIVDHVELLDGTFPSGKFHSTREHDFHAWLNCHFRMLLYTDVDSISTSLVAECLWVRGKQEGTNLANVEGHHIFGQAHPANVRTEVLSASVGNWYPSGDQFWRSFLIKTGSENAVLGAFCMLWYWILWKLIQQQAHTPGSKWPRNCRWRWQQQRRSQNGVHCILNWIHGKGFKFFTLGCIYTIIEICNSSHKRPWPKWVRSRRISLGGSSNWWPRSPPAIQCSACQPNTASWRVPWTFGDKQATPIFKRSATRAQSWNPCFRRSYLTKTAKACFGGQKNRETHVGGWSGQEQEGNN